MIYVVLQPLEGHDIQHIMVFRGSSHASHHPLPHSRSGGAPDMAAHFGHGIADELGRPGPSLKMTTHDTQPAFGHLVGGGLHLPTRPIQPTI